MNTNENALKTSPRLNRIKIASQIFRALNGIVAMLLVLLLVLSISAKYLPDGAVQIAFSPHQTYTSPFHIPLLVLFVGAIQFSLAGIALILLNRLFKFYERGIFFKIENIKCVKFLGLVVIGLWLTQTILELMAHQNLKGSAPAYPFLTVVFGSYQVHLGHVLGLLCGILVVFIAWVMDEGRKIQEEQELTV